MNILIVDDEREIADLVEEIVKKEGYSSAKFYDPEDALEYALKHGEKIDLAIIDIMMPGIDGLSLCGKIREKYFFPIILLTAKSEDDDKITGLSAGCDDYITKPFSPPVLVARIRAQIRRYREYPIKKENIDGVTDINGLVINRLSHTCFLDDKEISLTPTEFSILWLLCEQEGNVVSSEEIFENVWKEDYLDSNNTVMVHIRHLREKLGDNPRKPRFIKTVWGVGYKIER
ncbi:MAG: response regulator transcription factor [Eubacteriaceae bacterium]|nr:response regulator transcription factor [Eubacteriaceae bacterium]